MYYSAWLTLYGSPDCFSGILESILISYSSSSKWHHACVSKRRVIAETSTDCFILNDESQQQQQQQNHKRGEAGHKLGKKKLLVDKLQWSGAL